MARWMAYSPTSVLPLPVGALTTTEWPWFRASIASSWKGSRGKGKTSTIVSPIHHLSKLEEIKREARFLEQAPQWQPNIPSVNPKTATKTRSILQHCTIGKSTANKPYTEANAPQRTMQTFEQTALASHLTPHHRKSDLQHSIRPLTMPCYAIKRIADWKASYADFTYSMHCSTFNPTFRSEFELCD